jgi:spore coat polysaccharide biosynthesis protein SpsF
MEKAAIIQVRMDSSRFPGKAIKLISGKPLLWHVIERSKKIGIPVIVATTNRKIDDPIIDVTESCNVDIFRGSFEDVLDRYFQAAKKFQVKKIFRISADTPLIDSRFCKKIVEALDKNDVDYVRFGYNTVGIGMEGFTFNAIKRSWEKATSVMDREHVTKYIKDHPNYFKELVIESNYNLGKYHWTVEIPYDLDFVKNIFKEFNTSIFYTEDIIKKFNSNSKLIKKQ